ncbi:hypothetical protein [Herbaspirillum rhizosphaerae]|uniref:hypothetical protein n=1 Tax=Herbaspirillum rhizosphaerae TaxID=346179 RepID=UPI0012EE7EB2|nr:hypothetical protein [Herbaspirillum rhizosphaerae]
MLTFLGGARKVSGCRAAPGEGLIEERKLEITVYSPLEQKTDKTQSISTNPQLRIPLIPTTPAKPPKQDKIPPQQDRPKRRKKPKTTFGDRTHQAAQENQ